MRVTDPVVLEDIDAQFAHTVYHAARLRALQRRGVELPPEPSREARIIMRRSLMRSARKVPA